MQPGSGTHREVIAAHPARVLGKGVVDEKVKKALLAQLEGQADLEARAAVVAAVGVLGLDEAKKELVALCGGPRPNLREQAEEALAKLMPKGAPKCRGGEKLPIPSETDNRGVKGLPALACETSPVPFTERSVGMALAGRDTGSSQIFVTFAPAPHLDGEYAWLGTADGPWEALVEGDVIHDVILAP